MPQGFENALKAGAREVAIFTAASEAFNRKNLNCSVDESLRKFDDVMAAAKREGVAVRGYVSCVVGCPYQVRRQAGRRMIGQLDRRQGRIHLQQGHAERKAPGPALIGRHAAVHKPACLPPSLSAWCRARCSRRMLPVWLGRCMRWGATRSAWETPSAQAHPPQVRQAGLAGSSQWWGWS